jgi:dethiobiotin synthetase/adenosylmethionine--8-amino-7-oxononanoate aminotransferase
VLVFLITWLPCLLGYRIIGKMSVLWRSLRSYQIYGANTDVGKTVVSTILCKALHKHRPDEKVWYLKPISTGPLDEADDYHLRAFAPRTTSKCLFQFNEPVSPHIAAAQASPPSDEVLLEQIRNHVAESAQEGVGTMFLETAGGVHSPGPNGTSQVDLYRPLRLPTVFVADPKLGGISSSISAFESLHLRGYDLDSVVVFEEDYYKNFDYLKSFFAKRGISTLVLPAPPKRLANVQDDLEQMASYYGSTSGLGLLEEFITKSTERHEVRIEKLEEMAEKAHKHIWYPFTQHQDLSPSKIMTIDSAYGDHFQTYRKPNSESTANETPIISTFDGSASWWTQGLGHGNPELALAGAHAAGKYGHVMFAGAIHQPALSLAELLLKHLDNPRLNKVFYSDNGSTGTEVAMKMALTASSERYKYDVAKGDVGVLGLKGSYHGDTIGAMDASEPGTFNEKVHWYRGRGFWFEFPKVKLIRGRWVVEVPEGMEEEFGTTEDFESLDAIFAVETRDDSQMADKYRSYIRETLEHLIKVEGKTFGALIMEPVILGAGGMLFA